MNATLECFFSTILYIMAITRRLQMIRKISKQIQTRSLWSGEEEWRSSNIGNEVTGVDRICADLNNYRERERERERERDIGIIDSDRRSEYKRRYEYTGVL